MQRPEHLRRVALELVEDLAADGVVYAEVRFAPQLHRQEGLGLHEVIDTVHAALAEGGRRHGVETGLIVCCLRPQSAAQSLEVARAAADRRDKVCGLDLAADESLSALPHRPAFDLARDAGLRLTAHAGEAAGAASMREVLGELKVERIGHGVRIEEDPALVEEVRAREVSLDMCPRSNVQTRAVASLAAHPADRLLRRGLRVTISTDGRTPSATTVTREFARMQEAFGWGLAEFAACQQHAAAACFAPDDLKQGLIARMRALPRA
jgi:adenosine deaminase